MSKVTLNNLSNLQNENTAVTTINANNSALTTAIEKTLSRDGTTPNTMGASLDMNSNRIINLINAISGGEPITLSQLNSILASTQVPNGLVTTGVPVSAAMQPVVNASTIAVARNLLGISSATGSSVSTYTSRAAAAAATIDAGVNVLKTSGFYSNGDRGSAEYVRAAGSTNGGFQSADGQWWALSTETPNVRQFGAVGNGVADDYTAIQTGINYVIARNGGTLFFPIGVYKINTGLIVNSVGNVHLRGEGYLTSSITAGTSVIKLLELNSGGHTVTGLFLLGSGIASAGNGNAQCLHIKSTCVNVKIKDCYIVFGYTPLMNDGVDTSIIDSFISFGFGANACLWNKSIALWMERCSLDHQWPVALPSPGLTTSAWANGTPYSLGQVVSTGGFYIQCSKSGTSGGVAPTLQNYFTTITDGSAEWLLVCPTLYYGLLNDTGSSEGHVTHCDFTGCYASGAIGMTNFGLGAAPFAFTITNSVLSQAMLSNMRCQAGSGLMFSGNEVSGGLVTGASGVSFETGWDGDAMVTGNWIFGSGGMTAGIAIGSGTNNSIVNNNIHGFVYGVLINPNVNKFIVASNCLGSSAKWGANSSNAVLVQAGTSNRYNIVNNIVNGAGAGVTDNGTGVNKTITGNV